MGDGGGRERNRETGGWRKVSTPGPLEANRLAYMHRYKEKGELQETLRPNVIWVFGDQHRGQALSCNGDPNVSTPNIDNLATHGVNFESAVSGYPLCCPFRGSLLTGRYPHKCIPGHGYPLPEGQQTIAHVFKEHGYRTAYFGKWHLDGARGAEDGVPRIVPPHRRGGFDTWIGYENNNSQWNTWVHGGEGAESFQYRLSGYETDELTNLLIDYIKGSGTQASVDDRPFFAVLSVQPPHPPYAAPAEFLRRYQPSSVKLRANVPAVAALRQKARQDLAASYAMIENLDWNVGRILQALEETGQRLNTHVIFFSDHGDMLGSHGFNGKVVPYEESIRIPFVIGGEMQRFFGRRSGRVAAPVNHVDIAPTTLGLCGIAAPDWMEGYDYSHYRLDPGVFPDGGRPGHGRPGHGHPDHGRPGHGRSGHKRPQIEEPDSAYLQVLMPREGIQRAWRGIVTRDGWKYVCFEGCEWLVHNLREDPFEQVNLANRGSHLRKRRELNERLRMWVQETEDEFQVPRV